MNGYGERVSTTNIRGQEMGFVAKGWLDRLTAAYDRSLATRVRGPRTPGQFKDDPVMKANAEAVEVLLDGNIKQAIESLRAIEAANPGRYETAANLGTALELSGDIAGALKWITEGVKRNKESHEHSEWIHINILQAKAALKSDPHWLDTHTVSGINLEKLATRGVIETPQGSMRLYHETEPSVHGSIGWQLSERMSLIKPMDPIVAHLLYELALIEMEIGNLEDAEGELKLAVSYGLPEHLAKAQHDRLAPMMAEIRRAHLIDKMTSGVMPWVVLLFGSVILFYLCRSVYRLVSD
jgi:tetratricopeptide (TPR) repeat protein